MNQTKAYPLPVRQIVKKSWHTRALILYALFVGGHAAEHVIQLIQAFVLDWPRMESMGVLGLWLPELMRSEVLHFSYNLLQLIGLLLLANGFTGRAERWWRIAIIVQGWHFFEHFLLQAQWLMRQYLFGASKQVSIGELLVPRIELHAIYVGIVLIPTVAALVEHYRSAKREQGGE